MAEMDAAIYGRNRRVSIRFLRIAVAICLVTASAFFSRTGPSGGQRYVVPTDPYLALVAGIVLFAVGSAIANAYFEGGFAISVLDTTAAALAFGLVVLLSSVTGTDIGTDAPPGIVSATFTGIAVIAGSVAWGVGNVLRELID